VGLKRGLAYSMGLALMFSLVMRTMTEYSLPSCPVPRSAAVGAKGFSFSPEGDFLELITAIPVKVEVAVETANRLSCAEAPIESDSGEHDFRESAFDKFTGEELFGDLGVGVTKFQGVESGTFWGWIGGRVGVGVSLFLFGRWGFWGMICFNPLLIVGVEFLDGEGEDASSFAQGDLFSIVRDVRSFKRFIS